MKIALIALTLGSSLNLWAAGEIIHSMRRLAMSTAEAVPAKNYFVSLGAREGVAVGDRLPVFRRLAVGGDFPSPLVHGAELGVGYLVVLAVGEHSAVGVQEGQAEPALSLQYREFLLGDRVEPKSRLPLSGNALVE